MAVYQEGCPQGGLFWKKHLRLQHASDPAPWSSSVLSFPGALGMPAFRVLLEPRPLCQYLGHPRHLWVFTQDVFTPRHCQAAGVVCLLEQLSGKPTAGLLRARSCSLLLSSKCIHHTSLSPSSVPGMLLSLQIYRWEHSHRLRGPTV